MKQDRTRIMEYHLKLEKFKGDFPSHRAALEAGAKPFEIIEDRGNLLENGFLVEGIDTIWTLTCGGSATAYDNANARLGVGNSSAAFNETHTGLQGASQDFQAMDATYPTFGSSKKATFKATWDSAEGNFAWEEWSVDNGAAANKNINRKVQSLGTKSSGETWVLTIELSLANP